MNILSFFNRFKKKPYHVPENIYPSTSCMNRTLVEQLLEDNIKNQLYDKVFCIRKTCNEIGIEYPKSLYSGQSPVGWLLSDLKYQSNLKTKNCIVVSYWISENEDIIGSSYWAQYELASLVKDQKTYIDVVGALLDAYLAEKADLS